MTQISASRSSADLTGLPTERMMAGHVEPLRGGAGRSEEARVLPRQEPEM
jgi:hypothetical protein